MSVLKQLYTRILLELSKKQNLKYITMSPKAKKVLIVVGKMLVIAGGVSLGLAIHEYFTTPGIDRLKTLKS